MQGQQIDHFQPTESWPVHFDSIERVRLILQWRQWSRVRWLSLRNPAYLGLFISVILSDPTLEEDFRAILDSAKAKLFLPDHLSNLDHALAAINSTRNGKV